MSKDIISEFALPLTNIFNKSLQNGQFQDKLKIAIIVPIYKCDDNKFINNYHLYLLFHIFPKF